MIFFFYGPNSFAARQQIARLVNEFKRKTGSDLGLERIDGQKIKPEELLASLQAVPFLASSRLVIVEGLESNKTIANDIVRYLEKIPETTVAVFYEPGIDQRGTFFKAFIKLAKVVKFEPLSTAKLQQWVAQQAAAVGAEIERPAVGRLLDTAGEDQWRLSNEIAKLSAHRSPITAADINHLVEETHTETIFNLVEAMSGGAADTALKLYRQLREEGESEMYMLSMIIWQLRNLMIAKAAGRVTSAELAKAGGMSPFVASKNAPTH